LLTVFAAKTGGTRTDADRHKPPTGSHSSAAGNKSELAAKMKQFEERVKVI